MADRNAHLKRFVKFAAKRDPNLALKVEGLQGAERTRDLGISSLKMIMILAEYMIVYGSPGLAFRPEWVASLDDLDGLAGVLEEIEAGAPIGA